MIGRASGKVILFGEHAVVYGKPGIAVPLSGLTTTARVEDADHFDCVSDARLSSEQQSRFERVVRLICDRLGVSDAIHVHVTSSISVGAGLGSSASLAVALIRAISGLHKKDADPGLVNECEAVFHGTPSGIDAAVIWHEKPVFFRDGKIVPLEFGASMKLIVGETDERSYTRDVVAGVADRLQKNQAAYTEVFDQLGTLTETARGLLESGKLADVGPLMTESHRLLREIDVSSTALDRAVDCALSAGALGAKMSGAGRGGCMIALVDGNENGVQDVLKTLCSSVTQTEAG